MNKLLVIFIFLNTSVLVETEEVDINNLIGHWECEDEIFTSEHFSYNSKSFSKIMKAGKYETLVAYNYDYFEKGTMSTQLLIKGNWVFDERNIKIMDRSVEVLNADSKVTTDKNLSEADLKELIKNSYPVEDDLSYKVIDVSDDNIQLADAKNEVFNCWSYVSSK